MPFTFYLVGDGTDGFEQVVVDENGVGVIELTDGIWEVVEEGTLARTTVEIVAGEITDLLAQNSVEDDANVPGDGEDVATPTPSPTEPAEHDDEDSDASAPSVTKLPSTGSGAEDSGVIALAAAAAATLAGAGAFSLRKRR